MSTLPPPRDAVTNPPLPAQNSTAIYAVVIVVIGKLNLLGTQLEWWSFSAGDQAIIADFVTDVLAVAALVVGRWIHNRVTPVEKAAQLVDAARAEAPPGGIVGMTPAEQTRYNPVP
jgi:hypothetical protein